MGLVAALQSGIAEMPLHRATAVLLITASSLTIVVGLIRSRRAFLRAIPGSLYVLAGGALFWSPPNALPVWAPFALAVATCALTVDLVLAGREPEQRQASISSYAPAVYLVLALVAAAVFLFHDLAGYAGSLQRWEAAVVGGYTDTGPCETRAGTMRPHCSAPFGFAYQLQIGETVSRYLAQQFVWSEGILSAGAASLFYGAPTYALFHILGTSTWTLRLSAVVAMLLSIVVLYALARRFFGPVVAAAAAILLGLNACALFYGRYGSSPAGTMLAVLLAVWGTWLFLNAQRPEWWKAAWCAVALYVATLQYAPGRLVVLILLGFIPLVLLSDWRHLQAQRLKGLAIIVAAAAAVWLFQGIAGGQSVFLRGQGEQFFHMTNDPEYVASFCPTCREIAPEAGVAYRMALLNRWLHMTIPQYLALIGPSVQHEAPHDWDATVLPPLYYGPLCVFIIWGFGYSVQRWRSFPHACLLLWVGGATVALLLTSRVDAHRSMLLVVPLSLWGAMGIAAGTRVMTQAKIPRSVQHLLAAALALPLLAHDKQLLWSPPVAQPAVARAVADEVERIPGPVAVGTLLDPPNDVPRNLAFIELTILERERRDPQRTGFVIGGDRMAAFRDGPHPLTEADLLWLQEIVSTATVVLAPPAAFRRTTALLQARGIRIVRSADSRLVVLTPDPAPTFE